MEEASIEVNWQFLEKYETKCTVYSVIHCWHPESKTQSCLNYACAVCRILMVCMVLGCSRGIIIISSTFHWAYQLSNGTSEGSLHCGNIPVCHSVYHWQCLPLRTVHSTRAITLTWAMSSSQETVGMSQPEKMSQ